jgi:cyclophilin family peptidyl-prolyl cis-trans isomerase
MAKHKAATEISIAQEERSAFADFVDQYKWIGLGLLAVVAAIILWKSKAGEAALAEQREDWNTLYAALTGEDASAETVAEAAKKIKEPSVAAIARINQAAILSGDRKYQEGKDTLGFALTNAPAIFSKVKFPVGPDGEEISLLKKMQTSITNEGAWMDSHKALFENPPLPEGSPRVELNTTKGKIVIGLYLEKAPQHAKNFMRLAEEGYYNGTKFHRIVTGGFIQGGDPNSRNDEPETWGRGGPESKVPKEDSGLVHAAGALAAAKQSGQEDSSGSQFYLTATPQHQFDSGYVVYGTVLEGLEVIEEISNGELREDKEETPVELIEITSATVLQ